MSAQEKILWEGSPSQVTNLGVYIVCALLFFLVVPVFYAIWRWIVTRCFRYAVSDQRIRVTQGVFNKRTDSIELYRVKDVGAAVDRALDLARLRGRRRFGVDLGDAAFVLARPLLRFLDRAAL